MAALNVNQITADLAMKSDKDLQSYAITNKGDPYLLALAVSEANRRKHLRTAQQAHTGQQAQPKVVDQEVAQMAQPMQLPETVGIGSLPAQNIQKLAGGGIVAFDGGGKVAPEYMFDPNTGEMVEYIPNTEGFFSRVGTSLGNVARSVGEKMPGYGEGLAIDPLKDRPDLKASLQTQIDKRAGVTPAAPKVQAPIKGGAEPVRMTAETDPRVAAMQKTLAANQGAPDASGNTQLPGANMGLAGLTSGKSALFQKEAEPTKADYAAEYDTLYKALDEKNAKFLEGQKAKLKTDREEALYMSLIKGGLAAAAGTSKNALQNLAQGFGQGADEFNNSLKEFRKASQEMAKAEVEMERAQADRKAGRLDKYDAKMEKAKDRQLEADKALLSAQTTLQHANITAGATLKAAQLPPKEAQMAAMLGTGNTFEERFQSGLPKLTAIQAGKFDPRKAYTEYLVAAQRSGTGDILSYPEFAMQFAPRVSGDGSGSVLPRKD